MKSLLSKLHWVLQVPENQNRDLRAAEKSQARSFLDVLWLHQALGGLTDEAVEVGLLELLNKWALLSLEMRHLTLACIHLESFRNVQNL